MTVLFSFPRRSKLTQKRQMRFSIAQVRSLVRLPVQKKKKGNRRTQKCTRSVSPDTLAMMSLRRNWAGARIQQRPLILRCMQQETNPEKQKFQRSASRNTTKMRITSRTRRESPNTMTVTVRRLENRSTRNTTMNFESQKKQKLLIQIAERIIELQEF